MLVCIVCMVYMANQNDILDVNDIFRDLSQMVHEQGTVVGK